VSIRVVDQSHSPATNFADSLFESKYPNVVYEESDREVVVVNLIEGVYYFLTGTAAYLWMALHSGHTVSDVVAAFPESSDSIQGDVESFVSELMQLGLLDQVTELREQIEVAPDVSDYLANGYQPPVLETYADLQDILLLDPVHDVDETGWPKTKSE
jgi:hypothetical protein